MGNNPFDRASERLSPKMSSGGRPPDLSQKISFVVSVEECSPNTFDKDVRITMRTLSPAQEAAAARASTGDAVSLAMKMAEASLHAIADVVTDEEGSLTYGEPRILTVGKAEKELVWGWLGPRGRSLAIGMFGKISTPSHEALGKADRTVEIS